MNFKRFFDSSLVILWLISECYAYKILIVFPFPGKSHTILGEGYVRHLLNAGHKITYITTIPMKNTTSHLKQIDVSSNFKFIDSGLMDVKNLMGKQEILFNYEFIFKLMADIANNTIQNEKVQEILGDPKEKFDAVIVEWMYSELYSGFGPVLNCPLIWSSSMEPHHLVLQLIDEVPNPAYNLDHRTVSNPPLSFYKRIINMWYTVEVNYYKWLRKHVDTQMYEEGFRSAAKKREVKLPHLEDAMFNGAMMLGNSHISAGQPVKLPQNYVPILGYHIDETAQPLSLELKNILDNSKNGVIFFSMGSMLKSSQIPNEIKKGIFDVFSKLNQTVLWKFDGSSDNLPKNVRILDWAPQQSILAHPNCVLFITHGGLLSTSESLHFGVPIIGVPMFADQFSNINKAVKKGFAKRVDLNFAMPENLQKAISDILADSKYRNTAKELSFIYHDRLADPGRTLVHSVEHVIKTNGARYMRSPALDLYFYQRYYLDLLLLILLSVLITLLAVNILCKRLLRKDVKVKLH